MTTNRRREINRKKKAEWRLRHPILAAWQLHRSNAKVRNIEVKWTLEEFRQFCFETGYHLLRGDGWQIHRENDIGPYCYETASMVKAEINRQLQTLYCRKKKNFRDSFVGLKRAG